MSAGPTAAGPTAAGPTAAGPTAAGPASASPSDTATLKDPPPVELTARQRCAAALPGRTLLGWGDTTVGELRSYRYGPPNRQPVLADKFPGVPDGDGGTWCVTRDEPSATAWWGVADGVAEHVVTIQGPGEGAPQGEVTGGPVIP